MTDSTENREQGAGELARAFEENASAVVESRGLAPLKSRGGKARLLKTESGKIVTHGQLVAGLLQKQAIEAEVVDGKRPEWISCEACKVPVKVHPGPLPQKCRVCSGRACSECGAKRAARGIPGMCIGCAKRAGKFIIAGRKAASSKTPEQRTEAARKGNAALTREQRSAAGRALQAQKTPEQRSESARKADTYKTPEQRIDAGRKAWDTRRARAAARAA